MAVCSSNVLGECAFLLSASGSVYCGNIYDIVARCCTTMSLSILLILSFIITVCLTVDQSKCMSWRAFFSTAGAASSIIIHAHAVSRTRTRSVTHARARARSPQWHCDHSVMALSYARFDKGAEVAAAQSRYYCTQGFIIVTVPGIVEYFPLLTNHTLLYVRSYLIIIHIIIHYYTYI